MAPRQTPFSVSGGGDCDRDPYEVLGVPRSATASQIKTAYRKLALKHHPDKVTLPVGTSLSRVEQVRTEASRRFAEISAAHEILSDGNKRQRYDYIYKYGGGPNSSKDETDIQTDFTSQFFGKRPRQSSSIFDFVSPDFLNRSSPTETTCNNGLFGFSFTVATTSTSTNVNPDGSRQYVTKSMQTHNGKKTTRVETTTEYNDGTQTINVENYIDGRRIGDSKKMEKDCGSAGYEYCKPQGNACFMDRMKELITCPCINIY